MNLYQIEDEILSCVDAETGEIIDPERLESLQMEQSRKIENILLWIKNLRSDAEQIRAEEKALAERRKSAERKAESLTAYVSGLLDGRRFDTSRVSATFRKSESVVVDDFNALWVGADDRFLRFSEPEPDKTEIKKALKAGEMLPGCHLEIRQNLTIK